MNRNKNNVYLNKRTFYLNAKKKTLCTSKHSSLYQAPYKTTATEKLPNWLLLPTESNSLTDPLPS